MREEAFAKFARPLESQFAYEGRRSRGVLATAGAIAVAIGATVILALVVFNVSPKVEKRSLRTRRFHFDACIGYTDASGAIRRLPGAARRLQALSKGTRKRRAGRFRTRLRCNGQGIARKVPGSARQVHAVATTEIASRTERAGRLSKANGRWRLKRTSLARRFTEKRRRDRGIGRRPRRPYFSGSECSRKKRSISRVASGPRGSV